MSQAPESSVVVHFAIHSLLEEDLVDGFWLLIHPVIFGKGIPLFKNDINKLIRLTFSKTKKLGNGMICLNYVVNREA